MIGLIKSYGKLIVTTEYRDVPLETLEKVNYCLDNKIAFGLEHPEGGIWILHPEILMAAHYFTNVQDHCKLYKEWTGFELLVTRLLFTHPFFVGPQLLHKFLLACKELLKIQNDEHTKRISSETLPDATGKDGQAGTS